MVGSPPPIWATSASTVSPGASCSSRNRPARMINKVGMLTASRRPASSSRRIALRREPEIGPVARGPARIVVVVVQPLAGHRDELALDCHPDRRLGVDLPHELGIERLALC